MTPGQMRVVYAFEFLLAILAIFTAWSEIGGQAALDLMPWGWKSGLAFALATTLVGFTAALAAADTLWTHRSARWFAAVLVSLLALGVITYYYALQVDLGDSEDNSSVSTIKEVRPALWQIA